MTNVLDMIDEGTTDQPPIVKNAAGIWKRFGKRRSEDNDVPLQRKTSKVLKNVSVRDFKIFRRTRVPDYRFLSAVISIGAD